jgi:hypothetical protein
MFRAVRVILSERKKKKEWELECFKMSWKNHIYSQEIFIYNLWLIFDYKYLQDKKAFYPSHTPKKDKLFKEHLVFLPWQIFIFKHIFENEMWLSNN